MGQAQLGESLVMLTGPSWAPKFIALLGTKFGAHYIGKEDVCPNFTLKVGKFVFSNSGNFTAKANPPKPRSYPKRPFGQWLGPNSSADWDEEWAQESRTEPWGTPQESGRGCEIVPQISTMIISMIIVNNRPWQLSEVVVVEGNQLVPIREMLNRRRLRRTDAPAIYM